MDWRVHRFWKEWTFCDSETKKIHAQSSSSLNKTGNCSPFRTKQGPGCGDSPRTRAGGILTSRSSRLGSTRWREAVVSGHSSPFPPEWNITGEKLVTRAHAFLSAPQPCLWWNSWLSANSSLFSLQAYEERPLLRWLKEPRGSGTQTNVSFRREVTEAVYSLWGALHALQVGR